MTRRYLLLGAMVVLVGGLTVGCRYEVPVADQRDPVGTGPVAVSETVKTVVLTVDGMT